MRVKIVLGYDGTDFCGFQVQSAVEPGLVDEKAVRTVQGDIEQALRELYGVGIRITGAGRTDVGVHANGQCASFEMPVGENFPVIDMQKLPLAINSKLKKDVRIFSAELVADDFHAQASAKQKIYRYLIDNGRVPNPNLRRTHWSVRYNLNAQAMQEAGQFLVGEHDFKSFVNELYNIQAMRKADGKEPLSTIKTIHRVEVKWLAEPWKGGLSEERCESYPILAIEVEGSGFLYKMVRNIVGTLVEVGRGRQQPAWVGEVLAAKDRREAGPTANPEGLYMQRVIY